LVFSPQPNTGLIFPSDDRIIATVGANQEKLPLEAFAKALAAGKGELGNVPEMKKLIESVDTTQPLWGVAKMTESYRRAPVLAPFDTMTVVGKQNGAVMEVRIDGEGPDKEKVAGAVGQVNAALQMGIGQLRQAAQEMPILATFVKTLEGVKCTAQDQKATLTASLEGNATMMAVPVIFGIRSQHVEEAQRVVPPAQVQPVPPGQVQPVPQ
jgi:hypothetical protein